MTRPSTTPLALFAAMALALAGAGCRDTSGLGGLGPEDHAAFPISPGTAHENIECDGCHGGFSSFTQFTCHSAGCHAEVDVTPLHANKQVAAGYEYVSKSCYLCHPRGERGEGVDHTIFFPIQKGDPHQNTSCSVCHANSSDPNHVTCADGACHELAKTDALHPGVLGYDWGASTCLPCHPNGKVGSVDHKEFFPIDAGSRHATVACASCHTQPDDFSQISCASAGCHDQGPTDQTHADAEVNGYEYVSKSCYGCHPNGLVDFIDHSRFFPIVPGTTHEVASCKSCHPNPADRKRVSCFNDECHTEKATTNLHGAVLGFEYLSKSCVACHPDGTIGRDHQAFFPIGAGDKHVNIACETCHRDPVSRTPVSCVSASCHLPQGTDALHLSIPGYSYGSGVCLTCHVGGRKLIDHSAYFPIAAGTKHEAIACDSCHTVPGDRHVLNCASVACHPQATIQQQHLTVKNVQYQSKMCVRCHGDGTVPRIAQHVPFGIQAGFPHFEKECLLCHANVRADRPALAEFRLRTCYSSGCHHKSLVVIAHNVLGNGAGFSSDPQQCTKSGCHENGTKP